MRRTRRHWVWVVASLTVVALVLGASWWVTHPNVFAGQGSTLRMAPLAVDATGLVGLPMKAPVDVMLLSVRPNIIQNSAHASFDVVLCTQRGADSLGSGRSPLSQWCSSISDPHGATLHGLTQEPVAGDYLVLMITPRWPGTVRVDGLTIRYRNGLQTGTQTTGMTVIVQAH